MQTISEENIILKEYSERTITKKDPVFYNEHAKLSRDLTVLFAKSFWIKKMLDLYSGSGALGLRIAKATNADVEFYDINENAINLIKENAKLNDIKNIKVHKEKAENANIKGFKLITIDPFGSPAHTYKLLIKSAEIGQIFALKATDLGTLSGKYPNRALKRYGFKIYKNPIPREVAIRSLILFAENEANKNNKSVEPLISIATNYYIYVFLKIIPKEKKEIKYFNYCPNCLNNSIGNKKNICKCGNKMLNFPIYLGKTSDYDVIKKLEQTIYRDLQKNKKDYNIKSMLKILEKTKKQHLFKYNYNIPLLCKKLNIITPNKEKLKNRGVFLPFDNYTFTTWINKEKLVKYLLQQS